MGEGNRRDLPPGSPRPVAAAAPDADSASVSGAWSSVDADLAEEIDLYCRLVDAVGQRRLTTTEVDAVLGIRASTADPTADPAADLSPGPDAQPAPEPDTGSQTD